MLDHFDLFNLLRLNQDDAYYYFQTAWHMANGNFSTFDSGITRTNGCHPLWLFLITPFYWVFDKVEALYAIKAFEVMLVAGGAARVARLPWILLFGVLPTVYLYNAVVFGGVLPVSTAVNRWWSERAWELEGGYSLAGNFDAMLQHPRFNDDVPLALVLCGLLALVWWCARHERAREDWLLLAFMVGVFSLAAGHLAKFAQSVLITHPGGGLLRPGISYRAISCRPSPFRPCATSPPISSAGSSGRDPARQQGERTGIRGYGYSSPGCSSCS